MDVIRQKMMSKRAKKIIFSAAAGSVVIASFSYIFAFMQSIIPENINDVSKCSEEASKWTLIYCLVTVIFLFGFDRNRRFRGFHHCIKTLNFLLVLTPVMTALVDFLKGDVIKLLLWVNFIPFATAFLCVLCTVILIISIIIIRKYLDERDW